MATRLVQKVERSAQPTGLKKGTGLGEPPCLRLADFHTEALRLGPSLLLTPVQVAFGCGSPKLWPIVKSIT